jgi:ABC-type nitrate/sulfonate/bicarbonate transport system permease component
MGRLIASRSYVLVSTAAVGAALLGWQLLSGSYDPQLLPPPGKVVSGAHELIDNGRLQDGIWISLQRIFKGWIIGSVVAIPIGLVAGVSKIARAAADPFIHFFRFIPALALTSLFILWFGIGEASKVNLIAYAVAFVVLVSTAAGASAIHPDKILGAKSLGASSWDLFLRIILPGTFSSIYTGMRLALANAFLVLVAAEAIAAQEGIGFLIWNSRTFFRTDFMFVGILCFGILGFLSDRLWRILGRTVFSRFLSGLGDY